MNGTNLPWFAAALIINIILTPIMGKFAVKVGVIDHPSTRKFHLTSKPLLGGVAIATTFTLLTVISIFTINFGHDQKIKLIAILAASLLMMILGLIDDIKNISPSFKLAGQTLGTIILLLSGLRVYLTNIPAIDYLLTLIWVCGIINCLNLLDNIDGLSGGTAAIAGCFFALSAVVLKQPQTALICAVFSGACLGFLYHNFHPATIFSGDAGSMFNGAILASLGLLMMKPGNIISHLSPGVILGLLIFDTGLVTIYRLANGLSITDGGKDHTSHRLCNLGLSIQASVTVLFLVAGVFGVFGVMMLLLKPPIAILILAVLLVIAGVCWYLLKDFFDYSNHPTKKAGAKIMTKKHIGLESEIQEIKK